MVDGDVKRANEGSNSACVSRTVTWSQTRVPVAKSAGRNTAISQMERPDTNKILFQILVPKTRSPESEPSSLNARTTSPATDKETPSNGDMLKIIGR